MHANHSKHDTYKSSLFVCLLGVTFSLLFVGCGGSSSKNEITASKIQAMLDKPINDSEVTRKFYYDYGSQPDPGRRHWKKVGNDFWYELYPNGTRSLFVVVDQDRVGPARGIVGRKVTKESANIGDPEEGAFEIFIPNADTQDFLKRLAFRYYRSGNWEKWSGLGRIFEE